MIEGVSGCAVIQGASRGLGLALVQSLLERKPHDPVFATCRNPQDAQPLLALAGQAPNLRVLPLDVTREETIAEAARVVEQTVGSVDFLVNVSGILHDERDVGPEKRLESLSLESLHTVFGVNALGPMLVTKHFHPLLKHDRRAVLANVSARVGSIGDNRLGGWYAYRSSKAALNMFTRTAAIELQRRSPNVIVFSFHPGTVETDLSRPFLRSVRPEKLFSPERAAGQLLDVANELTPDDTGRFIAWDGSPIPW